MEKLEKIIKEVEETAGYYHRSVFDEVKQSYDDYVKLIILEAPNSKQYRLCDYWDRLKEGGLK